MNKSSFKKGDKVRVNNYSIGNGHRKTGEKTGKILETYDSYALVRLDFGYNECFRYNSMEILTDKEGE